MEKSGAPSSTSTTDRTITSASGNESGTHTSGELLQYYEFEVVLKSPDKLQKGGNDDDQDKEEKNRKKLVCLDEEGEGIVELPPNHYSNYKYNEKPQVVASTSKAKKRTRILSVEYKRLKVERWKRNNVVLHEALMRSIGKKNGTGSNFAEGDQVDLKLKLGH
ncbi:unnamed protein product [Linum trigynum]|uniref:Uncharacterized protein n=1 Tax=Linum trigynum TaxID=586398 RepID=A0AAV2DCS7_9ROSI